MELEEGEICCYDDTSIDEKVHSVLGNFQKDFEGGFVSAENLGAKFGVYGSFLPAYRRSPSVLFQPTTPQRSEVSHKFPVKHDSVGSDKTAQKSTRLHTGDGVFQEISSDTLASIAETMTSLPMAEGVLLSPVQEKFLTLSRIDSPTSILQTMTSFPVSGGGLLSPLHENLLTLLRKDNTEKQSSGGKKKLKPAADLAEGKGGSAALKNKESFKNVGVDYMANGRKKNVKQPVAELSLISKSNAQIPVESFDDLGKNLNKPKDHMVNGDGNPTRKFERVSDQYYYRDLKKLKADREQAFVETREVVIQDYCKWGSLKETKSWLTEKLQRLEKKHGNRFQDQRDSCSIDIKIHPGKEIPVKKRKLRDQDDSVNLQSNGITWVTLMPMRL